MKVFISADIEGVAGNFCWPECMPEGATYHEFAQEMAAETIALCRAALDAGADEVFVKDAHHNGDNIPTEKLPKGVRIIRGWEWSPNLMIEGIDESFDCIAFVGYHSGAGWSGNPLSHVMSDGFTNITINGTPASEFLIYSLLAAGLGVPTVFLAGDEMLCRENKAMFPWLETVETKKGAGRSVISKSPAAVQQLIYEQGKKAFSQDLRAVPLAETAEEYHCVVEYKDHADATRYQYFPGCRLCGRSTLEFTAKSIADVSRTLMFIM